jgi:hypothetical protein
MWLFCATVSCEDFLYLQYRFELFLAQVQWRKCALKMLVKLTTCSHSPHFVRGIFNVATSNISKYDTNHKILGFEQFDHQQKSVKTSFCRSINIDL